MTEQAIVEEEKIECPQKVILYSDNTNSIVLGGVEKKISDIELQGWYKKCPGMEKESAVVAKTAVVTAKTQTSQDAATNTNQSTAEQSVQSQNDTLSMITPYIDEKDIDFVPEAWSITDITKYWGFKHPGIDFRVTHNIPVRASASGTIENLAIEKSSGIMGWHAGFCIKHNSTYSVCYNLESFGSTEEVGQQVANNTLVKNGDVVSQGQIIGNLVFGGDGAHIDFGVGAFGTRPCPEPYLTEDTKASILRLIHKTQPTWPMCAE